MLVMDEVDEKFNKGSKSRSTMFIATCHQPHESPTLPHEILEMTTKFITDPIRILVKRDELTLGETILRGRREGGVEVRHTLRYIRHADYTGRDFVQHERKGELADEENAGGEFHSELNA